MVELSAREQIILAIDTSERKDAERLARLAKEAGARYVKLGLELSSATSWEYCSELAGDNELDWVADAKLHDIPNTVAGTVNNLSKLEQPPFAITMHTTAGKEAMQVAQETAGTIKILGVTVLTSIGQKEMAHIYHTESQVLAMAIYAAQSGLQGVVASPQEVGTIKNWSQTRHLFSMIPGTRSTGIDRNDQSRTATPAQAIRDGADLLVIGRQITQAQDPGLAFEDLVGEIETARS